jgi:phage terminase large subunit-like protein
VYSQEHADIACNFFECVLKHTADEWYGKPFLLAPWQEDCLSSVFGNIDDEGRRIIETVYLEVPKKSGKSEFAAGLLLLILALETAKGCQIYGAATAIRQALNVYRPAAKMVEQSPILTKRLRLLRSTHRIIKRSDPDSFYAAIAADGDIGDGVNPAVVVADEVHRWKTRKHLENWDVLSNGGITRRQTLTIAITTAGVENESPLAWRLHEKTKNIEKGIVSDPKFYGKIYGADKTDDPLSDATLIKTCPSLRENGGFMDIEKLRAKRTSLLADGDLTSWKRYFLNMWDQKENPAIEINDWDASAGGWEARGLLPDPGPLVIDGKSEERRVRPLPADLMTRFIDRTCWAGVDISMTTDLTAAVFVFPTVDPEETYEVLPFFWLPDAKIRKMEKTLGVPLRKWADDGFLELCPGPVIDTRDVKARLEWGSRMFSLEGICWDPWNSRQISTQMIDDGHQCFEVRQGFATLTEPTKKLLELTVLGRLHHGGHPVLRWMANCAAKITDGRDNVMLVKPDRAKTSKRIDGIAAINNALTRIISSEANTIKYRGVRSVG